MVLFACIHAYDFKMLMFALFIQGFGSIFEEFIGYIKTKKCLDFIHHPFVYGRVYLFTCYYGNLIGE